MTTEGDLESRAAEPTGAVEGSALAETWQMVREQLPRMIEFVHAENKRRNPEQPES